MFSIRIATLALLLGGALAPASLAAQSAPQGPDTVVYTKRGTVTFLHRKHSEKWECSTCHHASKPEKPLASEYQKCGDCHVDPPVEPMKTTLRNAFHDPEAKTGVCFDCHTAESEKGVAEAPVRCAQCHVRERGGGRP